MSSHTFHRQALYEEVWTSPLRVLAKKYSLSDSGLRNICLRMNVPLPGKGYWNRVAAGRPVERAALSAFAAVTFYSVRPQIQPAAKFRASDESEWLATQIEFEKLPENRVHCGASPVVWHPKVVPIRKWVLNCVKTLRRGREALARAETASQARLRRGEYEIDFARIDAHGAIHGNHPILGNDGKARSLRISEGTHIRALMVLNALVIAAIDRGYAASCEVDRIRLKIRGITSEVSITERFERVLASATDYSTSQQPTGRLRVNVYSQAKPVAAAEDTAQSKVEDQLNQVMSALHRSIENRRSSDLRKAFNAEQRVIAESLLREREEAELRRVTCEAEEIRVQKRRNQLNQQAVRHVLHDSQRMEQAARLRRLVAHIGAQMEAAEASSSIVEWCAWALAVASSLDPTREIIEMLKATSFGPSGRVD